MGVTNVHPTAKSEAIRACNKAELMVASICAEATISEIQACRRAGRADATNFMHAARISTRMPALSERIAEAGDLGIKHLDIIYCFISSFLQELEGRTKEEFDEWTEEVVQRYLDHTPAPTTAELRAFLRGVFMNAEPEAFHEHEQRKKKEARLRREREIWKLKMTEADSQRLIDKIDKAAKPRAAETGEDLDQARMQIVLDLLEGKKSNTHVHVHIYRTEGGGGWIPGVGAISRQEADRYQNLAESIDYIDVPADVDRYRPSSAQRTWVMGRDRTCRFPGCEHPATNTDIDHIAEYDHDNPEQGGKTAVDNLQCLCRHHHNLKTEKIWKASTTDGIEVQWEGPDGQKFTTEPD